MLSESLLDELEIESDIEELDNTEEDDGGIDAAKSLFVFTALFAHPSNEN